LSASSATDLLELRADLNDLRGECPSTGPVQIGTFEV
jgi:hypothetical protein